MTQDTLDRIKLVKARLLPLPPWEAALERLIERLPRQLVTVEMMPAGDVSVIDDGQGEFRANGPAPRFALQPSPLLERGGWYYLEAALVRNNGNREAALLVETHSGKCITIPIPTNLRGTVREVFFLPSSVRSLHWSPTAAAGYFSQSPLLIHRISPLESFLRRLYRLVPDLWRFRTINNANVPTLNLWGILARPHQAYLHTAELRRKRLTGSDYATFLALNARQRKRDIRLLQREMKAWPAPPLVSLIIAAQTPKGAWLREAISSVQNQLYPHWELVITGDIDTETNDMIEGCNKQKNRIRGLSMPAAMEKSSLLNSAFAASTGDFVGQLGQHDQLPPESLALLVRKWIMAPDCDLIYSDEDALDDLGRRCHPHFKPDWNPTLFYSHNYLGRLCLYRREGLLAINGYRSGYPEAEEYDLCLRLIRHKTNLIAIHAPGVGYHCRPEQSGTQMSARKEQADRSGKQALEDFFRGSGTAVADGPELGLYRIHHPLPTPAPLVSIIIPSRDKKNILEGCIESIVHKTRYPNWEILIV
ncbi:MAG: glycosyltransferase, partial [Desulfobulbus sp.]|nr:glycosyltransferase [Desulfobulbus sp.]